MAGTKPYGRPELLAPAGGPEQLRCALHFGADAVYAAGPRWGMRARARNFTMGEMAEAARLSHDAGAKLYVALNTVVRDDGMDALPAYLEELAATGADALIVADLGALRLARRYAPGLDIHISTQANVTNAEAAAAYAELGATRIVLARELTLPQVRELRRRLDPAIELEAFVHGSLCVAYSGRCLLSAALMGPERSASEGACAQPCRWGWHLADARDVSRQLPIEQDREGSYLLSSHDLCMIEHLEELAEAGVSSFKIEGRNKGAYYVATVVNSYRQALDGDDAAIWRRELDEVSHRPYSTGFWYGRPEENSGQEAYARDRLLIGIVEEAGEDGSFWAAFAARNRMAEGAPLVALAPGARPRRFVPEAIELLDEEAGAWTPAEGIVRTMGRYRIRMPFGMCAGDVIAQEAC